MKISIEKTGSGKVKISGDGNYLFAVPAIIWYASGLSDGSDIDEEELLSLKTEGNSSFAYEAALRLLAVRAHSKKELMMKLRVKYGADAAQSAADKCEALGLIDDEQYATLFASELYERKHYSPRRILAELGNRGVARDIAENVVNALDIDKNKSIIEVLEKMRLPHPLSEKDKNRAVRRLISMGYSLSEIRKHLDVEDEW